MNRIKISSFNVMTLKEKSKRFQKVKDLIIDNQIDIIGLQEITLPALEKLAKELKMYYIYGREGYQGNGILSRYKFIEKDVITMKVDSNKKVLPRNCIYVKVDTSFGEIEFANTHLDHLYEDIRYQQYQVIQEKILSKYNLDFLVGDFNTQYFPDYNTEELEAIQESRKKAKLEIADDKTVRAILSDNFKISKFIGKTCPYNTRVDYIFHKQDYDPKEYRLEFSLIDCLSDYISDHNMIILEITTKG